MSKLCVYEVVDHGIDKGGGHGHQVDAKVHILYPGKVANIWNWNNEYQSDEVVFNIFTWATMQGVNWSHLSVTYFIGLISLSSYLIDGKLFLTFTATV